MGLHDSSLRSAARSRCFANLIASLACLASLVAVCGIVMAGEPGGDRSTQPTYAWRLSVVDGGQPRGDKTSDDAAAALVLGLPDPFAKEHAPRTGQWQFLDARAARFAGNAPSLGCRGAAPLAGDFNGDGQAEIAIYVDGQWFIDLNGNGHWDDEDLWALLGAAGDQPVVGDWDGDGKTDIGVFGPTPAGTDATPSGTRLPDADKSPLADEAAPGAGTGTAAYGAPADRERIRLLRHTSHGALRADPADHIFRFGGPDAIAVVGDFNGDGIDTLGIFSRGRWRLDSDADGKDGSHESEIEFGAEGDTPVVGDFNGDGADEIGVFRDGTWRLDSNGNHRLDKDDAELHLGGAGDLPVVGDFDGDGTDEPVVFRAGATDK